MNITLSDRHFELAKKHAAEAGFDDVGEYIQHVLELDEAKEETHEEFLDSLREGLADIAAGNANVRPFDEFMAEIAQKYGLTLPK
jgi:hypothetical protein